MFKKRESAPEDTVFNEPEKDPRQGASSQKSNTILKGSKLTGDINITCDLELSGEVEGNINSEENSSIYIKGTCRGNIRTREGNVEISGELLEGDITAGGSVKITGKFSGGAVKARGRIYVDGEFAGRLESNEVEIGPHARGKGEISYRESISIARGALIEAHIKQVGEESPAAKKPAGMKVINMEQPGRERGGATT